MTRSSSETFPAFLARSTDDCFQRGVVQLGFDDLPDDGILIAVRWSSINYKDTLAASPDGRVAQISPLVVGIDLAGEVVESDVDWLQPDDPVIAHGYDIGVSRHGGYAAFARVPSEWIVPLPPELTLEAAMGIGTAGYTAALSVLALEAHGVTPTAGPILVTGATGGVGSVATSILAGLGYEVVASTGKQDAHRYLKTLGSASVIDRATLADTPKPLMAGTWQAAVDCVGGDALAGALARLRAGGVVAASGNTGGSSLATTVLPFILRGVSLLGIDSVHTPPSRRREVWSRLGQDLRPKEALQQCTVVGLDELDKTLPEVAGGRATGRFVVRIGA